MVYDVAVVGLGPAGVSALKVLEGSGLKVLVVESAPSFPRKKPCAGGLTPKAYAILKDFFPEVDSVVRKRVNRFILYNKDNSALLSDSSVLTYLTQREELDAFLFNSLNHSHFDIHLGETALTIERDIDGVILNTTKDSYRVKVLLVASGVNSRIARQLGIKREIGFTYESYVESSIEEIIIDFSGFKWGYYWAFPKGDVVTTGIGEFKSKKVTASLREILSQFNRKHGLTGKEIWSSGFPIPAGKSQNDVYRPHVLFLGDAGGLVDPLTGEGIYYAVKSGTVAAGVVRQFFKTGELSRLSSYETAINSLFGEEFKWARIVGKLFFSLKGLNFFVLKRSKEVAQLTSELLSGRISYRESFKKYLRLMPGALLRR